MGNKLSHLQKHGRRLGWQTSKTIPADQQKHSDTRYTAKEHPAHTLNSTYNEVTFNEKLAIMKENLHTKYFPFTYNDVALNEKTPMTKQNLCIFFFFIGRVECTKL